MRQIKKFVRYNRSNIIEFIDLIHPERFICSTQTVRLLSLDRKTGLLNFRFYSSCNNSHISSHTSKNSFINGSVIPRCMSTNSNDTKKTNLVESRLNEETAVSTTIQKIKRTSETVFWSGIVFCGLSFALGVIYVITTELFSSNSSHRIYSKAFKYVSQDERVLNEMGDQLKGFGEETRRGRRQHVSHIVYSKNGRDHLRMKFYIKGNRGEGSVHLEMMENDKGKYEYRYLFVVVDSDPSPYKKTIILEDNRSKYENIGKVSGSLEMEGLKELDLSMK